MQQTAVGALAELHSRETIPFLAKLLDSPFTDVRQDAIKGISQFVDNLPPLTVENRPPSFKWRIPQGPAPYKTPETDRFSTSTKGFEQSPEAVYVEYWKSWWARTKDQITSGK